MRFLTNKKQEGIKNSFLKYVPGTTRIHVRTHVLQIVVINI